MVIKGVLRCHCGAIAENAFNVRAEQGSFTSCDGEPQAVLLRAQTVIVEAERTKELLLTWKPMMNTAGILVSGLKSSYVIYLCLGTMLSHGTKRLGNWAQSRLR